MTHVPCLLSDPGGLRLHGDGLRSEGLRGQTSEQPAGPNQRVETATQEVRWGSGGLRSSNDDDEGPSEAPLRVFDLVLYECLYLTE